MGIKSEVKKHTNKNELTIIDLKSSQFTIDLKNVSKVVELVRLLKPVDKTYFNTATNGEDWDAIDGYRIDLPEIIEIKTIKAGSEIFISDQTLDELRLKDEEKPKSEA